LALHILFVNLHLKVGRTYATVVEDAIRFCKSAIKRVT
jgi:hypothetical protein